MRRRDVLIAAAIVGGVIALPRLRRLTEPGLALDSIKGLPGFRRVSGGAASSVPLALVGIEQPSPEQQALRHEVRADPCRALFGRNIPADPDIVPVAVFTDYNCPYCPTLSNIIIDLKNASEPIAVTWHDLPILGLRSEDASRAARAAALQDTYLPVHKQLMRSVLRPGQAQLAKLADQHGLDRARFLQDVASEPVQRQIDRSRAIASVFGIVGTPSLMVGRTLVVGRIDEPDLKRLIALERSDPSGPCSGTGRALTPDQ